MNHNNGTPRARTFEAELVIRWEVGAHMPKQILLPKGVTLASLIGMLRLAEKIAIEQYDTRGSSSGIVTPGGLRS